MIFKKRKPEHVIYLKKKSKKKFKPGCLLTFLGFCLFIYLIILIGENSVEKQAIKNNPLSIGSDSLQNYVGKEVPFHLWPEWGYPSTIQGTDNDYWAAYVAKANVAFISYKPTNEIVYINFSRESVVDYLKEKKERQYEQLKEQFNPMRGDHIALTRYIKMNMKDRGSFEHVETVYWDNGDHLIVQTKFRGKNDFGAKVLNTIKAKVSLDGEILEILGYD